MALNVSTSATGGEALDRARQGYRDFSWLARVAVVRNADNQAAFAVIELRCAHRNEVTPLRFSLSGEIVDRDRVGRLACVRCRAGKPEIDAIDQPRIGTGVSVGSLKIVRFEIVCQGHFLGDMVK